MRVTRKIRVLLRVAAGIVAMSLVAAPGFLAPGGAGGAGSDTGTPIEHVVVIFQENVSFDHYFATYPVAANPPGEPFFVAREGTPSVNGLGTLINGQPSGVLLTLNPNALNGANGADAINPFRLDRSQASTCDQGHNYGDEQLAFDQGLMDAFPAHTGKSCASTYAWEKGKGLVMGYFDGNTVTALWYYAQHFAMNDNFYGTTFGPSTPGLLNLVAGNTYPATPSAPTPKVVGAGTIIGDLDPAGDVCSTGTTVRLGGRNIGDLLNENGVTWGSFMGGFDLTLTNADGSTGCNRQSPATPANAGPTKDYIPHHAFFQYHVSTANPTHARPNSVLNIGTSFDGGANHQYDLDDFFDALRARNLPAVSFLKAPAYADGHAGYSDPLLEQAFLVMTLNALMQSEFWEQTAVIIAYDDSDGWYDHQMSPIVNSSALANDQLDGPGHCGDGMPIRDDAGQPIQGRCGYGPRLPLIVVSPFAKRNFVDHTLTDLSSIVRFIEDNWGTGRIGGGSFDAVAGPLMNMFDFSDRGSDERQVFLDPATGEPLRP
ncbi:MAG: phospholipase [Candidatus Rokuibacteriota bacterium]|nr:MAG: phospholipase [Candidatus Rokubacteria bacterium]